MPRSDRLERLALLLLAELNSVSIIEPSRLRSLRAFEREVLRLSSPREPANLTRTATPWQSRDRDDRSPTRAGSQKKLDG